MTIKKILSILTLSVAAQSVMAAAPDVSELQAQREHVMHQYITDLGKADAEHISSLFVEGGEVISTSRGQVDARAFFSAFLPEIASAETAYHQTFNSQEDKDHYAARFHFNFMLKDGETGDGEYVDEFVFKPGSALLTNVYMFENLKFN